MTIRLDPVSEDLIGKGWPRPSDDELRGGLDVTLAMFADTAFADSALVTFYDPTGNYAGLTFLGLGVNDTQGIGIDDLLAVTLLEVTAVPHAVRQLLEDGPCRSEIADALLAVGEDVDLADSDLPKLEAAADLYSTLKTALADPAATQSNRWVIASKLCARKRPKLMPVRDGVVVLALGLANRDFRSDWLVFRYLLRDPQIRTGLTTITDLATKSNPAIARVPQLRRLDSILWFCAVRNR